jgi:hypothetical protein
VDMDKRMTGDGEPLILHVPSEAQLAKEMESPAFWKKQAQELQVELATEKGANSLITKVAVTVALSCIGIGLVGLHFFNVAREDRQWLTTSSKEGEEWRVAVPPIERSYKDWLMVSPVVVVRGGTEAVRHDWEEEVSRDVGDALDAAGAYLGEGAGSALLVEMYLEGSVLKEQSISFTLTNEAKTAVIWRETWKVDKSPADWQHKLIQAMRLGIGGGMPDGTWNLRVKEEDLAARRGEADHEKKLWAYAKSEKLRGL